MKRSLSAVCLSLIVACAGVPASVSFAEAYQADDSNAAANSSDNELPSRVTAGLQVLYDFGADKGGVVRDRSGAGEPLNLRIADVKAVRRGRGSLEIRAPTLMQTDARPTRLLDAIRRSGEITVEAWIRPANTNQKGPARIVTVSRNANERNVTLGQDGHRYDVRLRTSETSRNGIPSLASSNRSVVPKLTHVVYTRERAGRARIYINGEVSTEETIAGTTTGWHGGVKLALANEVNGSRPWLGTYHLVAIYSRSLLPREVVKNYEAGPTAAATVDLARNAHARFFETKIAPLLARHCVECHDPATNNGGLDLSRRTRALAGGDSGRILMAGKPNQSLIWDLAQADEMPKDRSPLTKDEKELLRQWIEDGATWTLDAIDPAVYAHDNIFAGNWIRRLTVAEYIASIRTATGVDIAKDAHQLLPPDLRADGFSNTAYNLTVDLGHIEAYAQLASMVVQRMDVEEYAARFSKSRKLTDKDMLKLIGRMGQWILRGPLQEDELASYRGISTTVASAGGGFPEAVAFTIEAMLQSPRFLYRIEQQRGDGTRWPVTEFELASRISYILWGAPPDRALMDAAESDDLDRDSARRHVTRMLKDPRAAEHSLRFITDWLNLGRLENMQPDAGRFPDWDRQLAGDMRMETLEYFRDLVWRQNRPLADLLNAQFTFVTPALAAHYGFGNSRLDSAGSSRPVRMDLSSTPGRGGLLTHGSVLTVGGDEASMVTRGLLVLHELLRGVVKDPPPCVDTTPIPTKPGLTQRAIAEARIANQNCGGCHAKFEPLAFGLEKFDGVGVWHEQDEHGNRLRDDGEILFPGSEGPVPYETSRQLMDLLAASDRVRETLTWKVTQFSLGRPLVAEDAPIVAKIHAAAQADRGTWASLMMAIVMSDLVQTTRTEKSD